MFLHTNSSIGLNDELTNFATDIKEWLISNNILPNAYKTTLLDISPSSIYFLPFIIRNIVISSSPTTSILGVHFDSTVSVIPHITAYYHLFIIIKLRKSMTVSLTKTIINSFVLSYIYYCSS